MTKNVDTAKKKKMLKPGQYHLIQLTVTSDLSPCGYKCLTLWKKIEPYSKYKRHTN